MVVISIFQSAMLQPLHCAFSLCSRLKKKEKKNRTWADGGDDVGVVNGSTEPVPCIR